MRRTRTSPYPHGKASAEACEYSSSGTRRHLQPGDLHFDDSAGDGPDEHLDLRVRDDVSHWVRTVAICSAYHKRPGNMRGHRRRSWEKTAGYSPYGWGDQNERVAPVTAKA
jgi:hypothetical protein